MNEMPRELVLGDVYFSPWLPVLTVALIATWITSLLLNRLRLSRFIVFPSATFLAIMLAYVLLIDAFWIRI